MVKLPHWPVPRWKSSPGTPVERTQALLDRVGNPERRLPPVVHVAGTNGKGSTIAFLRHILQAAGYRVHCYVPPHIENFNERILLNGAEIEDGLLHEVIEECRMAAGDLPIKFFEGTTVAAFLAFARVSADILLLETGMGGRLDPTNVVLHPKLTIITPIHYDHMEFLGDTLAAIAGEKAGIMKRGAPCVISFQQPEALQMLEQAADVVGAPLFTFGKNWLVRKGESGMVYKEAEGEVNLPRPALLGDHQIINAGTAIAAASLLDGFNISHDDVVKGITKTKWKGRLEKIEKGKYASLMPKGWELWFDGAHNASGAAAMAHMAQEDWGDKPLFLIAGTTIGKDAENLFAPFKAAARLACGIRSEKEPKSYSAEEMAEFAEKAGLPARSCADVEEAIKTCLEVGKKSGRILVFGSFYLRPLIT